MPWMDSDNNIDRLTLAIDEAIEDLRSVADWVRWGAAQLQRHQIFIGHGCNNAIDEALHLVLYVAGLEPGAPSELMTAKLTASERRSVAALLQRRIRERIPTAYLTGQAWYCGFGFEVDQNVLVPRSPVGAWINKRFEPWVDAEHIERILDMGTGSGCLAILSALAFETAKVDAVDCSEAALMVAQRNIDSFGLGDRITVRHSDLFAALSPRRYDLIVCNPPYVNTATLASMPPEITHEPILALAGGVDGLDCVRRIVSGAAAHLTAHGILVLEVGSSRPAMESYWPKCQLTWLEVDEEADGVALISASGLVSLSPKAP